MRRTLKTRHFTKSERIFGELLKRHRIPFEAKAMVLGREIDFLVGNLAIEINGHDQRIDKNSRLLQHGFIPVNITNGDIHNNLEPTWTRLLRLISDRSKP